MITFHDITKSFGGKVVYDGFNARFEGVTAVMGKSGCGKTTLLNIAGSVIEFGGRVERASGGVAYMFQQPRLLKNLTVLQNLLYIGAREEEACAMLEKVEVEGDLYPKQLSGGMADRVSLARAFVADAGTLLMDEPFSGLDVGLKVRIMDLFSALMKTNKRDVLFVTHNPFEAEYLAQRAVVIDEGKIIADFSGDELTQQNLTNVLKQL